MYVGQTRKPLNVVLLALITCGIYEFYWFYQCGNDLNNITNEERINLVPMLILSIFCPPFLWYWMYKLDKGLAEVSQKEGIAYSENFILWLVLSLVLGVGLIVAMVQIQSALNNLWDKRNSGNGTVYV